MGRADREVEVEGVVVRIRDYADSHRILEVLSPSHGRMSVFARGGRASHRRFRGALDLFVTLRMQCAPSRDAWTLRAADVLNARAQLRRSLEQLQRASLLVECAALLSAEHEPTAGLYEALCQGLDLAAAGEVDAAVLALPRMVATAGIGPDASVCVRCAGPMTERAAVDSGSGVVCARCAGSLPLLPVAAIRGEPGSISAADAAALEATVAGWIEAHAGRRLRSRGAL